MSGSRPSRSPMTRTRTLLRWRSARSLRTKRRKRPISSVISAGGRDQFSELKEKIVRKSMPRSPAARTVRRSASTPRRWPSTRGSPRWAAQRPLPSMMMATCRGAPKPSLSFGAASDSDMSSCPCLVRPASAAALCCGMFYGGLAPSGLRRKPLSNRHDLFFFLRQHLIDLGDHLIGRLLDLARHALLYVVADLVILFHLLQQIEPVAAHVAHRDARGLGVFMRDLDQLLAPLLVELGNAQPDHLALGRGREAEIGCDD